MGNFLKIVKVNNELPSTLEGNTIYLVKNVAVTEIYVSNKEGTEALPAGGVQGLSAYQIALRNGFVGTEQNWLVSLAASGTSTETYVVSLNEPLENSCTLEYSSETLVGVEILPVSFGGWDSNNSRVVISDPGLYQVTVTARVEPVDQYGGPTVWPSETEFSLGTFVEPNASVRPQIFSKSSHIRRTNNVYNALLNFDKWTDVYNVNVPMVNPGENYIKPGIHCTPGVTLGEICFAKYDMVVTIIRIGNALPN